jgi:hypothetical protein
MWNRPEGGGCRILQPIPGKKVDVHTAVLSGINQSFHFDWLNYLGIKPAKPKIENQM